VIAKQSREGWFQSRIPARFRSGTTPALRATPPDSGGETLPQYRIHSQLLWARTFFLGTTRFTRS